MSYDRNTYMKQYYKTRRGRIGQIHKAQRHGSKVRGHPYPEYSVGELYDWANQHGYEALFAAWEASGFEKDLMPSTDRLDNSKGYSFDNMRLVTWKENRDQAYTDRKANILITAQHVRIEQLHKDGRVLQIFDSIEAAARAVSGDSSNILKVCQNRPSYLTSKGFRWRFAN